MNGQTVILRSDTQRQLAHRLIDAAPENAVVNIAEAKRTLDQNAKFHAMISDISRAKPQGRTLPTDIWKVLILAAALKLKVRFEPDLEDGGVVPVGFRSSKLTKAQMADVIEWMYAFGAEHNVRWSEPNPYQT